jgi:hypothetical protein
MVVVAPSPPSPRPLIPPPGYPAASNHDENDLTSDRHSGSEGPLSVWFDAIDTRPGGRGRGTRPVANRDAERFPRFRCSARLRTKSLCR